MSLQGNPYESVPDLVAEWRQAFTEFTPGVSDLSIFREVVARSADKVAYPNCLWTPDGAEQLYQAALQAASPWSRWWHRQAVRLSRQHGA